MRTFWFIPKMNTTFAKNTFCTSLFLLVHLVAGAEMNPGAVDPIPVCETLTTACSHVLNSGNAMAGSEVVFDQSKEQVYSPFDTAFSGMSGLSRLLRLSEPLFPGENDSVARNSRL